MNTEEQTHAARRMGRDYDSGLAAMMTDSSLAAKERLRRYQVIEGIGQRELGKRIGISVPTVAALLRGEWNKRTIIEKVEDKIEIPVGDWLCEIEATFTD